jgi:hypothetical protein
VPKILSFAICYFKFRIAAGPAISGSSGFASSGTSRIPLRRNRTASSAAASRLEILLP